MLRFNIDKSDRLHHPSSQASQLEEAFVSGSRTETSSRDANNQTGNSATDSEFSAQHRTSDKEKRRSATIRL